MKNVPKIDAKNVAKKKLAPLSSETATFFHTVIHTVFHAVFHTVFHTVIHTVFHAIIHTGMGVVRRLAA